MTTVQCPRCKAAMASDAGPCGSCGWSATEFGPRVATSDTPPPPESRPVTGATANAPRPPGTRPSDKTLQMGKQDILLEQLKKDLVADYEVERELGRGGMAVVYRAVERELHRVVALKVLPPGMGGADMAERFRREARLAAALDHQNIIPIYRVGQAAGTFFFAMKFVEGRAVDAIVEQQGALPVPVVLQVLREAADALAFAHGRSIIHRDIKGANILVDRDGRVMVSDFGIARAQEEKTLTASGSVIGTPHFMSPEQCSGQKVGPQSDQYALGILAFQMLTGSVPFDADSLMGILQHHFFTPVPDVREVRSDVPDELLAVVTRALEKEAASRFATTQEMLAAIEAVPFTDADRRSAEDQLRKLAVGTAVPKVRTGSLPPLPDARKAGLSMAASTAKTIAADRTVPSPRPGQKTKSKAPLVAGVVIALGAAGGVAVWQVQQRAEAQRRQQFVADSLRRDSTAQAQQRQQEIADSIARLAAAPRPPAAQPTSPGSQRTPRRQVQPAPPANPQPAPVVTGAPGLLRVSASLPNAEIFVDGRRIGQGTVFDEELRPGSHRLRITAPGCTAFEQTFTVTSDQTTNLGRKALTCQ